MAEDNNFPPLSTDELRSNASKWTLACDAGLLAHLEQFSQKVFEKANKTESCLNKLLDEVEEVTTNFNIVSNQFQSLQNSQFLENRVYDDETPTEDSSAAILTQNEENQQQIVAKYKEAVGNGLLLLDSHYEQVEVPESSDSDDDLSNGGSTLLLKPKIAYTQPLPLIIGSAEWWADDTVGLGDFLENDESEPELSNSDASPHVAEKRIRRTPSTTSQSSEDEDHSPQIHDKLKSILNEPEPLLKSERRPIENDLFGGTSGLFEDDLFSKASAPKSSFVPATTTSGSVNPLNQTNFSSKNQSTTEGKITLVSEDDAETDNSLFKNNVKTLDGEKSSRPKVPQEFTKELFSKLGSIAQNQNSVSKPTAHHDKLCNAQSTSPSKNQLKHSLEGKSEVLSQENKSKESNAGGLFDDLDDDDDLFSKKPPTLSVRSLAVPIKLFDDDADDGDIFSKNVASPKGATLEKNIDASVDKDSVSKKNKSVFNDDLFSDDLDGDLFSSSNNILPPTAGFSRLVLPGSENNSPVYVKQPGLTASTPAINIISTPDDHLFGSISRLEKVDSLSASQASIKPQNSENSLDYPSENDAIIVESVQYDSRDLGFIETSDISEIGNSENRDSPANWFNPQLSSTRSAAAYNETSGYKTAIVGTGIHSAITPSSIEASNILRNTRSGDQRISSVNEESDSTNNNKKVTNNSNDDTPSNVGDVQGSLPKNVETNESKNVSLSAAPSDHVFNASNEAAPDKSFLKTESQASKINTVKLSTKMESLFDNDEDEDLFSSKPAASSDPAPSFSRDKKASLFDDDGEDLFSNSPKKAADSIFNDSGRPHVFEEPTKFLQSTSTLSSIFTGKPTPTKSVLKPSPFEDVDNDLDLFRKINSDPVITSVPKTLDPETPVVSKLPSDNIDHDTNQHNSNITISKNPTPPSSLDICRVHDSKSSCDATDGESLAVNKKIGKLNIPINLKINPSTLLPGAKRVKPAGGQLDHTDGEKEKLTVNEVIDVPATVSSCTEASASLPGSEHILPSTLKDRVRVSIKRRPQSRRARQDALRSSGIDFSPIEEVLTPSAAQSPESIPSMENSCSVPSQNVLSPSTDEEDFYVPHLEGETHGAFDNMLSKKEEQSKNEPLLFDSAPVISPTEEADIVPNFPAKSKLFATGSSSILEEIIDDDLFSSLNPSTSVSTKNVQVQEHKEKKKKNKPSVNVSDSLFGDIDDDDIFLAKPASSFPSKVVSSVKASAVGNDGPNFIDPLGLLKQIEN